MSTSPSTLELGWRVDDEGHPTYWLRPDARAGGHAEEEVVRVPAHKLAKHTAIIAQSGSGKSFFLGRLVEEILLKTRAKVVVFDPNADFRKIHELQPDSVWTEAGYDPKSFLGMLPTEADSTEACSKWASLSKLVLHGGSLGEKEGFQKIQLWWPYLSADILAQGLSFAECVQLRHCHQFVRAISELLEESPALLEAGPDEYSPLLEISRKTLTELQEKSGARSDVEFRDDLLAALGAHKVPRSRDDVIRRAGMSARYVSRDVATYYFARASEFANEGMLRKKPPPDFTGVRGIVFDLPSLPSTSVRISAVNQVLTRISAIMREDWEKAMNFPPAEDRRVPRFIVVDEAHNLLPADPQDQAAVAVRDLFRTIAAEGRKFGMFLIVVSQRPDKLDPMILSECENKIVMHVDSDTVLEKIQGIMGFSRRESELLRECTGYRLGRGLLLGSWAGGDPVKFMSAARRTREGGRNLRKSWWASPASEKVD